MTKQFRAEILLFMTTLIWGSTFVVIKGSLDEASPLYFVALRFWIAAGIMFIVLFRTLSTLTLRTIINGSVLGALVYIGFATQTIGMKYTTASKSAFFTGMLVVFTPLVQVIVKRKLPNLGNMMGVILAAVGLYLLTSPEGSSFNIGDALTLICAFNFGWYIVYLDVISHDTNRNHLIFVQFLFCAVIGTASALLFETPHISYTGNILFALFYLALFSNLGGMWIQNVFQGDTTPTRAAVIFTMEPVVAAICAYFFRHEILGATGLLGAGIIIAGLLLSELSGVIPGLKRSVALGKLKAEE